MRHLPIGTKLNNECYQIKKVIGQGGFGITYLADEIGLYRSTGFNDVQHVKISRPEQVIIKELFCPDYCQREYKSNRVIVIDESRKEEFNNLVLNQLEEGKKLRKLSHRHIVNTRDIFKENDTAYMVLDYVESIDLGMMLARDGRLTKNAALKYISEILSALSHIHEKRQLHLDVKPSNILINKYNEAVLIDFGASQSYNETGSIVGKPSQLVPAMTKFYAPYEQADMENIKHFDATFDTYATGATLYHLITGHKPPLSNQLSSGREKLIPPSEIVPELDNDYLDAVIAKALSPLYLQRYKSAELFLSDILKEGEYIEFLATLNSLIDKKEFLQAKKLTNEHQGIYPETISLNTAKDRLRSEEKKCIEDKRFTEFYSQGIDWLNKQEYQLALSLLEKAYSIRPERKDILGQITICKSNLIEIEGKPETTASDTVEEAESKSSKTSNGRETSHNTVKTTPSSTVSNDYVWSVTKTTPISSAYKAKLKERKKRRLFRLTRKQEILTIILLSSLIILIFNWDLLKEIKKSREPNQITEQDTASGKSSNMAKALPSDSTKAPYISQELKTDEKPDSILKSDGEVPLSSSMKPQNPVENTQKEQPVKRTITFNGKKYTGFILNGVPNGAGTLYFSTAEIVSKNDHNKTMTEPGDYLTGKWNKGELEVGTLFDNQGKKKATIVIGRY